MMLKNQRLMKKMNQIMKNQLKKMIKVKIKIKITMKKMKVKENTDLYTYSQFT